MKIDKNEILEKICYTDLVYDRINKKLNISLSKIESERFILRILQETQDDNYKMIGKNFYVNNFTENIRITINRNTFRIITADIIDKNKIK